MGHLGSILSRTIDHARPARAQLACPLYPRKRTFSDSGLMSAKCQKRTLAVQSAVTLVASMHYSRLSHIPFAASYDPMTPAPVLTYCV